MDLRTLEDDAGIDNSQNISINEPGFLGYSKLSGLGSETITAPRAYSSGAVRSKNAESFVGTGIL